MSSHSLEPLPDVTIVLAVKNEIAIVSKCIEQLLIQDYAPLTIIVVDDHSDDGTADVLNDYAEQSEHIKVISLQEGEMGKKAALRKGVKSATSEWIVYTDADCFPASPQWISTLIAEHEHYDLILGVSPYKTELNKLLNDVIAYESIMIAFDYLSSAVQGHPYMAVGRNMAFKRRLFETAENNQLYHETLGGSDDLFLHAVKHEARVGISVNPLSYVWTMPEEDWKAYYRQKARHIATAPRYPWRIQLKLLAQHLVNLGLIYLPLVIVLMTRNPVFFGLMALTYFFKMTILRRVFKTTISERLAPKMLYLDFILSVFYFILSFSWLSHRRTW